MSKNEYINCIEKALVGQVTTEEIHETVQYYNDYFDMEIKNGKTEQEIINHLGDPRLLAKTIITAYSESEKSQIIIEPDDNEDRKRVFHIPFPLTIIAGIIILILIIVVGITLLSLIFPFLILFIIIFIVTSGIIYFFKK